MSIGIEDEARTALRFTAWEWNSDADYPTDFLPEGWTFLGSGSHRTAFRGPSGWVYKILNDPLCKSNELEFANYERCSHASIVGWSLPQTAIFRIDGTSVIAMEFVDGQFDEPATVDEPFWQETWNIVQEIWDIVDIHPWNVIKTASGMRVLIDFSR